LKETILQGYQLTFFTQQDRRHGWTPLGDWLLKDQPLEVTMALSEADAERMFQRLREEKINVFFVKAPIEFGMTGEL
jgi:hypothetical protein